MFSCVFPQLQSPESFAKSIQELTIVLQRTGDPANLTSLRPHLELLANIDHNPGALLWVRVASQTVSSVPDGAILLMGVQMLPLLPGMSWKV